jgi:hypothetical protein
MAAASAIESIGDAEPMPNSLDSQGGNPIPGCRQALALAFTSKKEQPTRQSPGHILRKSPENPEVV